MGIKKTSIGGQALIEGIMMKGPKKTMMAVRKADGSIELSEVSENPIRNRIKFFGFPVIRGMVNLIESMITGYKCMMKSADISGFADIEENTDKKTEEELENLSDEEKKREEKRKNNNDALVGGAMIIGTVLGVGLALLLFFYLPSLAYKGLNVLIKHELYYFKGLIEGVIKMILFIGYIAVVTLEKDIKRVFMYHGAEHKTIFCYEKGLELNVENVSKQSRFHPRCGTSFMFLMLAIGILISSVLVVVLPEFIVTRNYLWVPLKILILPLTCGLGYELIKFCGRHDNVFTRIIAAPGLWIQRLTTKEPDDNMIEIAIAAVTEVIPDDNSDEIK